MNKTSKENYIIPANDTAFMFFPFDLEDKPKSIETFAKYAKDHLAEHIDVQGEVTVHKVFKNNMEKTGICFKPTGSNMGPTVYLDDFLNKDWDKALDEIADIIKGHIVPEEKDFSDIRYFEKVKSQICYTVVGTERNKKRLTSCPHRVIKDLALIYHIAVNIDGVNGKIEIKNDLMRAWDVSESDLYELAMENTKKIYPAKITSMKEYLLSTAGDDVPEEFLDDFLEEGFFIASNRQFSYGAGVMFYPGLLKEMEKRIGGDFYIIPSSAHEVIFISDCLCMGPEMIRDMVTDVNRTVVLPEDVLTDNVYKVENGKIV